MLVPYFEPGLVLDLLETEQASGLTAVPTMLLATLEHPDVKGRDLSHMRSVASGGAVVPADLVRPGR